MNGNIYKPIKTPKGEIRVVAYEEHPDHPAAILVHRDLFWWLIGMLEAQEPTSSPSPTKPEKPKPYVILDYNLNGQEVRLCVVKDAKLNIFGVECSPNEAREILTFVADEKGIDIQPVQFEQEDDGEVE